MQNYDNFIKTSAEQSSPRRLGAKSTVINTVVSPNRDLFFYLCGFVVSAKQVRASQQRGSRPERRPDRFPSQGGIPLGLHALRRGVWLHGFR